MEALYNKLKKKNQQTIDDYATDKIISDGLLKQFINIKIIMRIV